MTGEKDGRKNARCGLFALHGEPGGGVAGRVGDEGLDFEAGGVEAEVIVGAVAPAGAGEHPVVLGAAGVHLLDLTLKLFGGGGGAGLLVVLAAGQLVGHVGADEELEGRGPREKHGRVHAVQHAFRSTERRGDAGRAAQKKAPGYFYPKQK